VSATDASRRIFVSHSSYDTLAAKIVKDVLGRAGVGRTFLDADDLRPGDHWLPSMRAAIAECDAIVTLLTPEFVSRPWMSAEWACFWATGKTTYVLRLSVAPEDMFEPMRTSQLADLTSVSSMTAFLDAVAEGNAENYALAVALVERVERARSEQALAHVESLMKTLLTSIDAVPDGHVKALITAGQSEKLAHLHECVDEPGTNLTRVRLNQVARLLIQAGVASYRLVDLTRSIGNANYQRDLTIAVLASPESASARRDFADAIFDELSNVARRRVVSAATEQGFQLSDKWQGIEPYGM
jgi:hypothetical protein